MASIQEPRLMAWVRYLNFIYILPFTFQILTQAKISRSWSGFPFDFNNLKTAPLQTRIVNWSSSVFAFAISIYKYTTVSEQTFWFQHLPLHFTIHNIELPSKNKNYLSIIGYIYTDNSNLQIDKSICKIFFLSE